MSIRLGFLLFRSRSGSTLIGDKLSKHPQVLVTPESNFVPRTIEYLKQSNWLTKRDKIVGLYEYLTLEKKFQHWGVDKIYFIEHFSSSGELTWQNVLRGVCELYRNARKPGADIVVLKKDGWYSRNINVLLNAFDDSVVIWVIRDPRATFNSARKALHSETAEPLANGVRSNAREWLEYVGTMHRTMACWPYRTRIIKYEFFLSDPIASLKSLWSLLNVDVSSEMAMREMLNSQSVSHLVSPLTKHLHPNVGKSLLPERIDAWKKELGWLPYAYITFVCRREIKRLGYASFRVGWH